ncbi:hypothetical protein [Novosphingobium sp. SG707]|uniref:hypothetical protein n=1 Tax=Novosphingobium sp. SG707 TaxID=2586996 RepID=UPI001B2FEDE1|nr:hypothetical protein [Novosphingobium sp. SG707]
MPLACLKAAQGSDPDSEGTWVTVPPQSLRVAAGSPLDFSAMVPARPAGLDGALTIDNGRLTFADHARPHFNCGMLANGPGGALVFPTHEQSDELAEQMRRHGYSLARLHQIDIRLLRNAAGPMQPDPEQLDRFYYLLAALKSRGIHWMLDIFSHGHADLAGGNWFQPVSINDLRVRIHFDPTARQAWTDFTDRIFAARNPYTGASTLSDPALAFVTGANENGILFSGKPAEPLPPLLTARYAQWLKQQPPEPGNTDMPVKFGDDATHSGTFRRFVSDLEIETYRWMEGSLRARGFKGPVLGYHEWYAGQTSRTRAELPIVDVHAYVGEVTSFAKGAPLFMPSSTQDAGLNAWMLNASARWLDKPFVSSEYGEAFPNPHRFESGLLFPAVAAFQGYDMVCRMASVPVEMAVPRQGGKAIGLRGYSVGLDPTERASETLSALLFARGDVRQGTGGVAIRYGAEESRQAGSVILPVAVRRLPLLVRFGLVAPDRAASLPADMRQLSAIDTGGTSALAQAAQRLGLYQGNPALTWPGLMASLRSSGALPVGNISDPSKGLYQSATGELTLDQHAGSITIVTPRTEAVSSIMPMGHKALKVLSVASLDAPAVVAASALDGEPLASSHHILLVLSSDSRNTGMYMPGYGDRRQVGDWGSLPIRMRRVKAAIMLNSAYAGAILSPLTLAGEKQGNLLLTRKGSGFGMTLDTAPDGYLPTTFFVLDLQ